MVKIVDMVKELMESDMPECWILASAILIGSRNRNETENIKEVFEMLKTLPKIQQKHRKIFNVCRNYLQKNKSSCQSVQKIISN